MARRLTRAAGEATIARLGGDEFAVLLSSVAGSTPALAIAHSLLAMFREPFTLDSLPVELEASVGVAVSPDHGTDAAALLQRADIAMYMAKRAHTGAEVFSIEHEASSRTHLTMLGELRRAIENDELMLYFQPQLELRTGAIRSFEALLRWQHPVARRDRAGRVPSPRRAHRSHAATDASRARAGRSREPGVAYAPASRSPSR